MPNYEPTPRRFSVISVSRGASRRNSLDGAARPNLGPATPSLPPTSSPIDLAGALKQLQHVETRDEVERGRARHARGKRGHDGTVAARFERSETSTRTKDRIAMWEERSRSQSKGRSRSMGRDAGPKARVSMVPELPELFAALAAFEARSKQTREGPESTTETRPTQGITSTDGEAKRTDSADARIRSQRNQEGPGGAHEAAPAVIRTEKYREGRSEGEDVGTGDMPQFLPVTAAGLEDPRTKESTKERVYRDIRPQTPVHAVPGPPLTPEATPNSNASGRSFSPGKSSEAFKIRIVNRLGTPSPTAKPAYATSAIELPLTPETTPEQRVRREWPVCEAEEEHAFRYGRTRGSDMSSRVSDSTLDMDTDGRAQYHDVWRIRAYQPDFPLPLQRPGDGNIQYPGDTRFDGRPLQRLPQGRLIPEVVSRDLTESPNPYPYARGSDTRHWIVNIPPSPPVAYAPARPRVRPSQASTLSGNRGTREGSGYVSRREGQRYEWDAPPVIERALHAASVGMIQGLSVPVELYRGIRDTYYPPPGGPNIIKAYPIRRRLPVR